MSPVAPECTIDDDMNGSIARARFNLGACDQYATEIEMALNPPCCRARQSRNLALCTQSDMGLFGIGRRVRVTTRVQRCFHRVVYRTLVKVALEREAISAPQYVWAEVSGLTPEMSS
jgi:hypothetical protein